MDKFVETVRALVRPVIALSMTGALLMMTFQGKITEDVIIGLAGMVLGYYFNERTTTKTIDKISQSSMFKP